MSEEDLELLITLDDPEGAPEDDRFHLGQGSTNNQQQSCTEPTV